MAPPMSIDDAQYTQELLIRMKFSFAFSDFRFLKFHCLRRRAVVVSHDSNIFFTNKNRPLCFNNNNSYEFFAHSTFCFWRWCRIRIATERIENLNTKNRSEVIKSARRFCFVGSIDDGNLCVHTKTAWDETMGANRVQCMCRIHVIHACRQHRRLSRTLNQVEAL